jgi:hypothetical protein
MNAANIGSFSQSQFILIASLNISLRKRTSAGADNRPLQQRKSQPLRNFTKN